METDEIGVPLWLIQGLSNYSLQQQAIALIWARKNLPYHLLKHYYKWAMWYRPVFRREIQVLVDKIGKKLNSMEKRMESKSMRYRTDMVRPMPIMGARTSNGLGAYQRKFVGSNLGSNPLMDVIGLSGDDDNGDSETPSWTSDLIKGATEITKAGLQLGTALVNADSAKQRLEFQREGGIVPPKVDPAGVNPTNQDSSYERMERQKDEGYFNGKNGNGNGTAPPQQQQPGAQQPAAKPTAPSAPMMVRPPMGPPSRPLIAGISNTTLLLIVAVLGVGGVGLWYAMSKK